MPMKNKANTSGAVIWFTGLSGAGKSTLAKALAESLIEHNLTIELLDGDEIRKIFPQLGFSRAERNQHVERLGHLASVLEKHGVISIVALISPFAESRQFARSLAQNFFEIHVSTPIATCEKRDPKGLYKKARRGELKQFTGIDDPYEVPTNPELVIDTTLLSIEESLALVKKKLEIFFAK